MISKPMNDKLNQQITAEFAAAHNYLAMACTLEGMGLKILTKKFLEQSEEERGHAMKIINYIHDVEGTVALEGTPRPQGDFSTVKSIVSMALEGERKVTGMIHELVALAELDKDYPTRSFLQWFVDEQVEEEASMRDLLNLVDMAGENLLQVEARVRHEMTGTP